MYIYPIYIYPILSLDSSTQLSCNMLEFAKKLYIINMAEL